jgi:hypothetical protein
MAYLDGDTWYTGKVRELMKQHGSLKIISKTRMIISQLKHSLLTSANSIKMRRGRV